MTDPVAQTSGGGLTAQRKNEDLKAEYVLIQGQYEAFDQRALGMKALATPLLGAGLAFGVKEHSDALLYATILVAASLWLLEAIWKGFQKNLAGRIGALEAWYRNEGPEEMPPFQIYTAWNAVPKIDRLTYVATRMFAPFIALPYLVVILACLVTIPFN
ncbi:hypothetical protein M2337_002388 [Sphingobium sp. B2D3A]|uniref:hypothetical protein n=1 Tax=unclassified Sphingobium TaxID=2611147 RepID=UPI002225AA21|nr:MULTISPECIES: hypothetical protein [unclassified Sphingobium]MCW2338155.1 hypothetical protein [Sphingobium sp. B2D3A]MCW2384614.1 hypothetical protein [Sphingobium sp. B2D3D]